MNKQTVQVTLTIPEITGMLKPLEQWIDDGADIEPEDCAQATDGQRLDFAKLCLRTAAQLDSLAYNTLTWVGWPKRK